MTYQEAIIQLMDMVSKTVANIDLEYKRKAQPTLASSEFLTNKAQGDWAETLILEAINHSQELVAVHYGRSDDLIAGEDGFDSFYESYQDELERIGKRPDLLVFRKIDYNEEWKTDISNFPEEQLNSIVPKAIAGFEIRSSSFLIDKYEQFQDARKEKLSREIYGICSVLMEQYSDILQNKGVKWFETIKSINESSLNELVSIPCSPRWSVGRAAVVSELIKELRKLIKDYQKRDHLSITPKAEDLAVVCTWIKKYNVPHYYLQVFFDNVYAISFYDILKMILSPERENHDFSIESDVKNQNKTTIKINTHSTLMLAERNLRPNHHSVEKELPRGRLLYYVEFDGGGASLDMNKLYNLIDYK